MTPLPLGSELILHPVTPSWSRGPQHGGHLGPVGDPLSGAVIDRGRIVLPGDPGLGACPRPDSENTWEK
ncbi:hypothetical protein OG568_12185 [Streptomyces sp. NBC_01450]|uniref:hypothetical protein n=1 Tax=Streptomyces sp. NBC_01450 TaxID=2903871 RepID=UPI002E348CEB|nr:hypothetical protein [Streptomyces sp. NBC_01450]